ncbi:MAG: rod shape-determining protein RodA [Candidatus Aminicenantes bacterium]|nr:rod shape-determining protein RodA [Candidatus Aminicenantes bacterium]
MKELFNYDTAKYFDKFTFAVLLLLSAGGVVLIYSASHSAGQSYVFKQLLWLLFSIVVFFIVFLVKTEKIFASCFYIYAVLAGILVLQIAVGQITSGTKSWIKTGFFNIQVSEFIKVALALCLAKLCARITTIGWKAFFKISFIIGLPFVLIALQPDLGTAFMLVSFFLMMIFLKGIKPVIVVCIIIGLVGVSFTAWQYVLKPYQKDRIVSFLNPEKYEKSSGYQIIQSKIAIGSGGLSGKGYLSGTQSQYKFLPTRHTDFIISVLGEEFGFLGISVLLLLFFVLFYRQFNLSDVRSDQEFYFVYLFNGLILFQFLINISMSIGFFPILGIPLPFVSYGGSSLLAFFIGEAIVFRVKLNNFLP